MRFTSIAIATFLAQQSVAAPNILLVIADDMGVDASPCHNAQSIARMPNLEALCDDGMVFENAYSAPLCSPTRATILTGKYGSRTGVGAAVSRASGNSLSSSETTLFDHLNATQYSSAVIGKWHLSADSRALDHPADLGVGHFFGSFSGGVKSYDDWQAVENGRRVRVSNYATSELTDKAIDWISGQDSSWFLWLAYNAPHSPFHLPPRDLHSFSNLTGTEADIRRNTDQYYFAALEALDTEFGRLLDTLDPDERDNTIIIFMGDNGTPSQAVDRSLRSRAKGSLYEGGVNVPLVISGHTYNSGRTDALVNTTDLFATILDLADTPQNAPDSISLVPILQNEKGARDYAYVEHFSDTKPRGSGKLSWAIRDQRYKLIAAEGESPALYDLLRDPSERSDLLKSPTAENRQIATGLEMARTELLR